MIRAHTSRCVDQLPSQSPKAGQTFELDAELDHRDDELLGSVLKEIEIADDGCVLASAAFVDGVRLIDHVYLGHDALPVTIEE